MRKPVYAYANNKGADQPAHPRRLLSASVVRCLDSIIPLVSISDISSLYLAYVAAQAGLSLNWSETPKTDFLMISISVMETAYEPHRDKTNKVACAPSEDSDILNNWTHVVIDYSLPVISISFR